MAGVFSARIEVGGPAAANLLGAALDGAFGDSDADPFEVLQNILQQGLMAR